MISFSGMMRKLFMVTALILLSAPYSSCWAAAVISDEAQRELSSQTNTLYKKESKIPEKLAEKPEIVVEKKEEKKSEEEGPVFFVKQIRVEGNTVIPSRSFEPFITAFENRQTSFGHLRSFSEIITNLYRSEGYVTSRAYIPPQTVENDTITVKIVEGKVGKIFVEGNQHFSAKSYTRYMKFGADRIFRYQDLENSLYYLNLKPDRQAKAYLIAGVEPTSSDIILKVKDKNPFHAYYDFNNHGTKLTHYGRHSIHLNHNNLFGFDDVINTSITIAEESAFDGGSFSYSLPVGETPLSLSLSGGYVKTRLIGSLKSAKINGESLNFAPGFTYSFVQKPSFTFEAYIGLNYVNSISTIDSIRTSADRIRSFQIGPRLTLQDTGGRTLLNSDVHIGLPGLFGGLRGTDDNASITNSGNCFLYYTANLARLQRLPASMLLILRAGGQWTADTLPSTEQYRAGGSYSVRGYPESDAGGDYGWSGSTEINMPIYFLPRNCSVPYTKKAWCDALRLVGFLDAAKTYLNEKIVPTTVKDKFLLGAGFGVRLDIDDYVSMTVDLGWPIGDDSSDNNRKQVHLAMKAGF